MLEYVVKVRLVGWARVMLVHEVELHARHHDRRSSARQTAHYLYPRVSIQHLALECTPLLRALQRVKIRSGSKYPKRTLKKLLMLLNYLFALCSINQRMIDSKEADMLLCSIWV